MSKLFRGGLSFAIISFLLFSNGVFLAEDEILHIYYVDVGQADAAIITCGGMVLMIDGGNPEDSSLIYSMLRNTLGIEHIDYMIATHPHADHVGGLSGALNACEVDVLYTPVLEYDSKAFASMMYYAHKQNTEIIVPEPCESLRVGSLRVELLAPTKNYSDYNDMSIVTRITYGDTTFLFTGDIGWDVEHDLVEAGVDLSTDVLKVSHHGSDTSSSYIFLREAMPTYAVISVGKGNPYGHPAEETLSRLEDVGAEIFRTDELGTIHCSSDGYKTSFDIRN